MDYKFFIKGEEVKGKVNGKIEKGSRVMLEEGETVKTFTLYLVEEINKERVNLKRFIKR